MRRVPLPAEFKRVEITESPGTNGKTVQQFTHGDASTAGGLDYYALWFPDPNLTFSFQATVCSLGLWVTIS